MKLSTEDELIKFYMMVQRDGVKAITNIKQSNNKLKSIKQQQAIGDKKWQR